MRKFGKFFNPYVENSRIFRVGEKNCSSSVRKGGFESLDVRISLRVRLYDYDFVTLDYRNGSVGRMREEGRDDLVTLFLLALVTLVCPDYGSQSKDSVRATTRLDAEHVEPGNRFEKLTCFVNYLKHSLSCLCGLQRMHVEQLRRTC